MELLELVTSPEASFRATAMLPTRVVRVPFRLLQQALAEDAALATELSRALGVRSLKASQLSACNATHDLQGRLARYLSVLCMHGDGPLPITQESLAMELAVRRSSVCLAMHELGKDGVLEFSRGKVVVLDRPALAGKACECLSVFAQPAVAPVVTSRMIHHVPLHESRAGLSR